MMRTADVFPSTQDVIILSFFSHSARPAPDKPYGNTTQMTLLMLFIFEWLKTFSARCHCVLDPRDVIADFCVHPRLISLSAAVAPRHNSLELSFTCHGTSRVALKIKKDYH